MWYNMPINAEIIKAIQTISNPFWDVVFQGITMMGEEAFFMVIAAIIFWCVDKEFGYRLGFAYLSNSLINSGVKQVFKVPRPIGEPGIRSLRLETAGGYSFPSGHSQGSSSFWTSVMVKYKKKWLYAVGVILILLVGISRLYLGVHRPIDVLVGIIIGVSWVFVSNFLFDYSEKKGNKLIFLVVIIPAIIIMFILGDSDFSKVAGVVTAFYAGYVIEPKYIKYETKSKFLMQVVKFVIGFAVLYGIRTLFKMILPSSYISDFIRYFLMGIWVTIGATYTFKKLFGAKQVAK